MSRVMSVVADESEEADLLSYISWLRFLHTYVHGHAHVEGGRKEHIVYIVSEERNIIR